MNYGKEMLRKAGTGLLELDQGYSKKVNEILIGDPEKAGIVRSIGAGLLSSPLRPPELVIEPGDTKREIMLGRAYQAAAPVIGGAVRYGLPAAGITAAGMGLARLAEGLNQQTSGTLDAGNGYNYIENVPKERTINGSPEGEVLVAGSRGFGEYADYDPVILGSRVNDLQEQMGYKPVRASGFYAGGVIPED